MAHDRRQILTIFADELAVRDYVRDKVGHDYLTKVYCEVKSFKEIQLMDLPRNVVFKPNHASGAAVIVADFIPETESKFELPLREFKKFYLNPDSIDLNKLIELGDFW